MLDNDDGCAVSSMSTVTWLTAFPDVCENAQSLTDFYKAYLATAVTSEKHPWQKTHRNISCSTIHTIPFD